MMQTIPHGIWTRVLGTDLEVYQPYGSSINIEYIDGSIEYVYPCRIRVRDVNTGESWFVNQYGERSE